MAPDETLLMAPADPDDTRLKVFRAASSLELVRLIISLPSRGSDETADLFIFGLIFLGLRMFSVAFLIEGANDAIDTGGCSDSSSLSPSEVVQHRIVRDDPRETPEELCGMPASPCDAVPVFRPPVPSHTVE